MGEQVGGTVAGVGGSHSPSAWGAICRTFPGDQQAARKWPPDYPQRDNSALTPNPPGPGGGEVLLLYLFIWGLLVLEDRRAAKGMLCALRHFSRLGCSIPVLHEGNESQGGRVSRPCPHRWLAGWVAELGSGPYLTLCPRSNHQVARGTVGWPGRRSQRSQHSHHRSERAPGVPPGVPQEASRVGGGEGRGAKAASSPQSLLPGTLTCRQPPQAKAHLSTINILSTNYFTWVSKSEDPSISV